VNLSHVRCAHHGPAPVTAQDIIDNYIMSKERISIEWGFCKIKQRCPYCTRSSLLKFGQTDVARNIRVCVLMTNIHTCLRQSQTGHYFDCFAPSLAEYLA
jgi:hypothetical protein